MKKRILLSMLFCLSAWMVYPQPLAKKTLSTSGLLIPRVQQPYFQRVQSPAILKPALTGEEICQQINQQPTPPHEQKYALDSVIYESYNPSVMQWHNDIKKEHAYSTTGRILQTYISEWDQTGAKWKPKEKESFSYDANGNILVHSMQAWNPQHMNWTGSWKLEQQFNAQGQLTERVSYSWADWINNWLPEVKTTYQYDWNNAIIVISCDMWDITNSQWNHDYREDLSYDANNNLTQHLMSGWDNLTAQWVPVLRTLYSYNSAQELTTLTNETFNPGTAQWTGEYRHQYQYNTQGLVTEDIYSEWRSTTGLWENKTKTITLYSSTGKPVALECSVWKYGGQWVGNWKEEYDYTSLGALLNYRYYEYWESTASWIMFCKCEAMTDTYGNQLQHKWFFWDVSQNQWIGDEFVEYAYQYNYPACQTALPITMCDGPDSFCHVPQTALHFGWNPTVHSWEFKSMITYFCSALQVVGIKESEPETPASLYPNPAISDITLQWPGAMEPVQLVLLNAAGSAVMQTITSDNQKIAVGHLPKGLYFYQVSSGTQKGEGTLIIQ